MSELKGAFAAVDPVVERKMRILFSAYSDQHLVNSAPQEIEELRRRAQNYGIVATIGIFSLNEVARLTMRSRKSLVNHTDPKRMLILSLLQPCSSSTPRTSCSSRSPPRCYCDTRTIRLSKREWTTCGAFTRAARDKASELRLTISTSRTTQPILTFDTTSQ